MRYVSIDPGISGAIALLEKEPSALLPLVVELIDMPTMAKKKDGSGHVVNYAVLANVLARLSPKLIVLEQPSGVAAPRDEHGKVIEKRGMGTLGAFNFGVSYGIIIGCAAAYPQIYVRPASWKRRLKIPSSADNKDFARTLALQLFPYLGEQLKRKKDVGRAEAVLIGLDYWQQTQGYPGAPVAAASSAVPSGYTQELFA